MRNCSLRWQLTATEQPRSSLPEQPSPSVVLADDHRFACSIFAPWPMAHDLAQVMPKLTASTTRARILTAVTASGSISLVMEEPIVALTPLGGHLARENVHHGKNTSGVHS